MTGPDLFFLPESDRLKAIAICDQMQATIAKLDASFAAFNKAAEEFVRDLSMEQKPNEEQSP